MKHGDISNKVSAFNIGVRLNGFLVDPKRMNFARRAWSKFGGKLSRKAIDPVVARFVEHIFYRTSFTVDLVYVGEIELENMMKYTDVAQDIPRNKVHLVEDIYGVERRLYCGVLSYYVTTPLDVEQMSGEHVYTIERFNSMLKKSLK